MTAPRELLPQSSMPYIGDFVVLTINPALSVAHLDSQAKQEAAKLRPKKYLALVNMIGQGLPLKTKATNEYCILLVRDAGKPVPLSVYKSFTPPPSFPASQLALPISPYAPDGGQDHILKPKTDFPRPTCELDLSFDSLHVRVTTASRDHTKALSVSAAELGNLYRRQNVVSKLWVQLEQTGKISQGLSPRRDIKVKDIPSASGTSAHDDVPRSMLILLEHEGNKKAPVVEVHYDLSAVADIEDPSEFMREKWELSEIVERATHRVTCGST